MANEYRWIRTGNWSDYHKAELLCTYSGKFKQVLLFFDQVEDPEFQHAIGFFNFLTHEWHLCETFRTLPVSPSHFQLLTTPNT